MATLASHDTRSRTAVSAHAVVSVLSSSIWGLEECCGTDRMDSFSYGAEGGRDALPGLLGVLSKAIIPSSSIAALL